jgi:hypothetical protein
MQLRIPGLKSNNLIRATKCFSVGRHHRMPPISITSLEIGCVLELCKLNMPIESTFVKSLPSFVNETTLHMMHPPVTRHDNESLCRVAEALIVKVVMMRSSF